VQQPTQEDYIDPRIRNAPKKAKEILIIHRNEWSSIIDAYWLLRKYEDEIGVPVTYDIVEKAYEQALRELGGIRAKRIELSLSKAYRSETFSGKAANSVA